MRLFAAGLLIAASVTVGRCIINKLIFREKALDEILLLINELMSAVRYSKKAISDVMYELKGRSSFADTFIEAFYQSDDFDTAWKSAISKNFAGLLSKEEVTLLYNIGQQIGRSDVESELLLLNEYKEKFSAISQSLRKENTEKKKLLTAASWLTGAFIAVLVI